MTTAPLESTYVDEESGTGWVAFAGTMLILVGCFNIIDGIAAKIDETELRQAQQAKDAVRAYELVYAALGA